MGRVKKWLCPFLRNTAALLENAHKGARAEGAKAELIHLYFGSVTGEMRSFLERLFFPLMTYTDPPGSLLSRKVRTAFIYTLGATKEMARERGFDKHIGTNEMLMKMILGASETLCSYDTCQFEDYSKVYAPRFDPEKKAKVRAEVFPVDCEKAFEMGTRLVRELR